MPTNEARRIRGEIEQYAADPRVQGNNVTALVGRRPCIRLRVGDWFIITNDRDAVLDVIEIGSRSDIYP